ncbi:hypothetical protein MHM84_06700 [Halomonas sp. McH1-25]|uniref:hypothetical protein n=1 Tax=unclassified Halomonas TaxID=2609666 RepID=UPI001EF43FD1|nr:MULTISPECIES: hypothetical protein [unclassified Halomonas]MCG7599468.1 hypothetical protein [Halomonas sp. McH1-25]MCP1342855.1 hypothetical protein [Halomonas sp. FL8]MCP1361960.1 hypothetical protein [Halomonas sp. BBD45]MCP1366739.1 hypothetical protein [Halomonas sp. BBD48]
MLKVTLELRCNVCGGERFMLPTLDEAEQDVRCADCHAFKCRSDSLEETMAHAKQRRLPQYGQWGRLAS